MSTSPGVVLVDGQVVPQERAVVSIFDRGFLYGDSVFETMRAYAGVALDLERHLDRLLSGAQVLGIHLPLTLAGFAKEVQLALSLVPTKDWVVRVTQTRGVGSIAEDPLTITGGSRIVTVTPFESYPGAMYEKGIGVTVLPNVRPSRLGLAVVPKHGNYLHAVLARLHRQSSGAGEVILLDEEGFVAEGATSNILWVRGKKLCLPPAEGSILAGITQMALVELGQELGLTLEYSRILPGELCGLDEVFLSSSLREIVPVVEVESCAVGSGLPGPVYRALRKAYHERTSRYVAEAARQ
jgi:branched-chain amino acid aminotransferase